MNFSGFKWTYIGLKIREHKHRYKYKSSDYKMKQALERYHNSKKIKDCRQIKKEIKICKKYWGCYPLHYFRYNLYRREKILSEEELINYIPEFYFYTLFLSYFDTNKYSILLGDKNLTEQLFRSLDIKQPETICKLINGEIYERDLHINSFNEFIDNIQLNKSNKIFIKPVDGQGGFGIEVFHKNKNGDFTNKEGFNLDEDFIKEIGKRNNYIIQYGIIQDKGIEEIYPNSINTFRIATENKSGNVRVICSVLRMGKHGKEVDNASQDGLILGINVRSGKCNDYAFTEMGKEYKSHPDTHFVFKDTIIKNWDMIMKFVIESASKLPQFTYLGWDIALSEDGPIAIEANLNFALDLYQIALGGLREAFRIDNPNFYWKCRSEKNERR